MVHGEPASRCCPWTFGYVLSYIPEKIEISKERVLNYFFPLQCLTRWRKSGGGIIVTV
jgi:hypothetical protein